MKYDPKTKETILSNEETDIVAGALWELLNNTHPTIGSETEIWLDNLLHRIKYREYYTHRHITYEEMDDLDFEQANRELWEDSN